MPLIVQDNRPVKVTTVLAENTLLFSSLSGTERLSHLFDYSIEVVSEDLAIDLDSLTGTDITIELELPLGGYRYFHGFIAQCSQIESSNEFARYELVVRPWFWFLTRTADCRIFQEMSVPDIIQQIFDEEGFSDYDISLIGSYEAWNYCVQYRETDFNFVSRLMEQEGIYYYFKHDDGVHTLILSDSFSAHDSVENYDKVPYYPVSSDQIRERDHISHWEVHQNLQPGAYATKDFNFEDPKSDLLVRTSAPCNHVRADYEIYDYPGEFPLRGPGEAVAGFRMEEIQAQQNIVVGGGTAQGLNAGNLFTLTGAGREDQNKEYLITESNCSFHLDNFVSGGSTGLDFQCHFNAIPSSQPFRAPRSTPKPIVQGPQTAIVVGPSKEEIWTDEYGRVKLQFHWDRYGKSDEKSSCWVRVTQVWAGQGWGSIHIPRIGHEVIVEFLEGDPDRPIITGRVYNGDNDVPYDLPENQTQSGIKSRSTLGGSEGNFNEIRMEDKKGEEDLYLHAEKNHTNVTKNDRSENVGHDRSLNVGNDKSEKVVRNNKVGVDGTHTETIKGVTEVKVTEGTYLHDVVTGTETRHVGSNVIENFDDNQTTTVENNISITATKGQVHITAQTEIQLKVGDSLLVMKKDGTIRLSGKDISVSGSAKAAIGVGSQNLTCDKQKVASAGAAINSSAVGMHEISGAVVKIN